MIFTTSEQHAAIHPDERRGHHRLEHAKERRKAPARSRGRARRDTAGRSFGRYGEDDACVAVAVLVDHGGLSQGSQRSRSPRRSLSNSINAVMIIIIANTVGAECAVRSP